jgi:hypothetical protein
MFRSYLLAASVVPVLLFDSVDAKAAFLPPSFRGQAQTTYQEWNVFSTPEGPNVPDVANNNPNGTADVRDVALVSFVTGSGNIYALGGVLEIEAQIPAFDLGSAKRTNVVVQILSLGAVLDVDSVTWNGLEADSSSLLSDGPLGGQFGGRRQEWSLSWDLVPGNTSADVLYFKAASESMSLDRLSIDTQAVVVPETGSVMMVSLAVAMVMVGAARRHSR